ncbi:MAG: ribosome maturation factor RimM [Vicinamibacteria bacterium]|nr:ribosome maturation factor RimM [Vicinamibacteria bacterium]
MNSSPPRSPKEDADSVTIGIILRPHGIRGEVVVEPLTDNETRFATLEDVRVVRPSGSSVRLKVTSMFPHKGRLVIQFEGIATIEDAETLRASELRIPVASLPSLPAGSYYHHELRGLDVRVESGDSIGTVTDLWETGATPVLVIHDAKARETLLPLVDAFIIEVDVKAGFMRVKASGTVRS